MALDRAIAGRSFYRVYPGKLVRTAKTRPLATIFPLGPSSDPPLPVKQMSGNGLTISTLTSRQIRHSHWLRRPDGLALLQENSVEGTG